MTQARRYPGSRSFQDSPIERLLFRGRDREKDELLQLILAHDLVLLYARSGVGKTSLLNAGVLENLRIHEYFPCMMRLNSASPMRTAAETVLAAARKGGLEYEAVDATSDNLVLLLGRGRFWRENTLVTPVIIFDQFEELFTLHEAPEREAIIGALSDLAMRRLPGELEDGPPLIAYKIVFSIREDYLGDMETIASKIPTAMHHRFRLTPLSAEQARKAIREPAAMENRELAGRSFRYSDEAVDEMIWFLARRRERGGLREGNEIEPFQLQIICQHVEQALIEARCNEHRAECLTVAKEDLGGGDGMDRVLEHYYNDQIARLPEEIREQVHKLCEDGLINPVGKRISLEEEDIENRYGVSADILKSLVDYRLIRAEPRVGSTYYELSHDSLVAAVQRTGADRRPARLLEDARSARDSGDFTYAVNRYVELLNCAPQSVAGYEELSTMLIERADVKSAMTLLAGAREQGVESAGICANRSHLLLIQKKVKKAQEEAKRALQLDSQFVPGHIRLAEAMQKAGQNVAAENCYREALKLAPDDDTIHAALITVLLSRRQFNRLEEHVRAIADSACFVKLLPYVVDSLVMAGASPLAVTILGHAFECGARNLESMQRIAESAQSLAPEIAAKAYEAAAKLNRKADIDANWGVCAERARQARRSGKEIHSRAEAGSG